MFEDLYCWISLTIVSGSSCGVAAFVLSEGRRPNDVVDEYDGRNDKDLDPEIGAELFRLLSRSVPALSPYIPELQIWVACYI